MRVGGVITSLHICTGFLGRVSRFLEPADARFRAAIQHLDLWSISFIARFVKIASLLAAKTC